jgi:dihydroorotase-like cyclic amidohydrolase
MFPVVATEAARRGVPLPHVVRMLTETPARLFGLYPRKGTIRVGSDADLAIVALGDTHTIRAADLEFLDQSQKWTPYEGREVDAEVVYTILRGQVVYEHGRITGSPGDGQLLTRDG